MVCTVDNIYIIRNSLYVLVRIYNEFFIVARNLEDVKYIICSNLQKGVFCIEKSIILLGIYIFLLNLQYDFFRSIFVLLCVQ